MPYVNQESRDRYFSLVKQIANAPDIETKGDFEYLIMVMFRKFMHTRLERYSDLHDAVYAIQHVADETRRRFLDQREEKAQFVNGDVDPYAMAVSEE